MADERKSKIGELIAMMNTIKNDANKKNRNAQKRGKNVHETSFKDERWKVRFDGTRESRKCHVFKSDWKSTFRYQESLYYKWDVIRIKNRGVSQWSNPKEYESGNTLHKWTMESCSIDGFSQQCHTFTFETQWNDQERQWARREVCRNSWESTQDHRMLRESRWNNVGDEAPQNGCSGEEVRARLVDSSRCFSFWSLLFVIGIWTILVISRPEMPDRESRIESLQE